MPDVYIKLGELEAVVGQLDSIITEFEDATDNSEALEGDIGDPFDKSDLRDKARDFEERWDDKRHDLKEGLTAIRDHVKGVFDGFTEWDSETAIALEPEE